jgi:hypothetical protein
MTRSCLDRFGPDGLEWPDRSCSHALLGGAMYWDPENIAKAKVNISGEGAVSFEVDQGPVHPWNGSVGTSVVISQHWETFVEYGFNFDDVQVFATGLTFRF